MILRLFHCTFVCALGIASYLFTSAISGFAQTVDTTVYTIVEKSPEFPGGLVALREFMKKNIQYPPEAQKAGIKGRVFVSFVVETDGNLTNVRVLNSLGYGCDEEAIRVLEIMPRWHPGSQSGRPLRVKHALPALFGIDYPKRKGD